MSYFVTGARRPGDLSFGPVLDLEERGFGGRCAPLASLVEAADYLDNAAALGPLHRVGADHRTCRPAALTRTLTDREFRRRGRNGWTTGATGVFASFALGPDPRHRGVRRLFRRGCPGPEGVGPSAASAGLLPLSASGF